MCSVSMIGDVYTERWGQQPITQPLVWNAVTRAEFDALRSEVELMKTLLLRAKKYDAENGEPDCEMDDKVALLKKVADLVGVSLEDVFG